MRDRTEISTEIHQLADDLRQLEIRYEQYFAGVERREPLQERELIGRRLRFLTTCNIIQTDLRFRAASLNSRFQTYSQYWNRILRLMEEGRYHRGSPPKTGSSTEAATTATPAEAPAADAPVIGGRLDTLFAELEGAYRQTGGAAKPPSRDQFDAFIRRQQEAIRARFGDEPVEFAVDRQGDKPKIVVRRKR